MESSLYKSGWGGRIIAPYFSPKRSGGSSLRAVIKLIPADNGDSVDHRSRWAEGAKVHNPHLIRLFGDGRCEIDGIPLLYVVMEYAEENLAEVLPLRALTAAEVSEMLQPAAEALAALHHAGFVHSCIKPSNVMAVDNRLKLSVDGLRRSWRPRQQAPAIDLYDAPEVSTVGFSAAADIWSLGMTLLAALTQNEPKGEARQVTVPQAIPEPLRRILENCLQADPAQRCTVNDILKEFSTQPAPTQGRVDATRVEPQSPQKTPKRWIVVAIVLAALFFAAWIGGKVMHRHAAAPASETPAVNPQSGDNS